MISIKERLVLVLTADIQKRLSDGGQGIERGRRTVDMDAVFAGPRKNAPDRQFIAGIQAQFAQFRAQGRVFPKIEKGFYDRRILVRADHVGGRPVAQQQADRADDNGFAGAGFTGNHVETL
jgi:hypothetical protein